MAPTTIAVEPLHERHWLQVSYLLDALGNTKTDKNDSLPPGTFRKFRTSEKDGVLCFNIVVPRNFPSSWLKTLGVDRPDCSLRAGPEESGDPEYHVLKIVADQFPADIREHLEFLQILENNIGVIEASPEGGTGPRGFQGYGLASAIVRGMDYVFTIPADISVRPLAGFLGLDRKKIIREILTDDAGAALCDAREVPLHRFTIPIALVRAQFSNQNVDGQKTVTFTRPKTGT